MVCYSYIFFNKDDKETGEKVKKELCKDGISEIRFNWNTGSEDVERYIDVNINENDWSLTVPDILYESYVREIIKILKNVYQIVGSGGYGLHEMEIEDEPDSNKSAKEISRFWSLTILTPKEVKKYGRDKVLNAPCKIIEEWEDGAVLLLIENNMFSSNYSERKKLREYFGES